MTTADKDSSVAKGEDLETLIVAEVPIADEQHNIIAWNLGGEQEILSSRESCQASVVFKMMNKVNKMMNLLDLFKELNPIDINHLLYLGMKASDAAKNATEDDNHAALISISSADIKEITKQLKLAKPQIGASTNIANNILSNKEKLIYEKYFDKIIHINLFSKEKNLLAQFEGSKCPVLYDIKNKKETQLYGLEKGLAISASTTLEIPKTLKFTVLGIGDANCLNNTSFIIEADKKYLVDIPVTLEQMLKDNKLDVHDINNVIITHAHGDHVGGLQWFLLNKMNEQTKINVYTTNDILEQALSTIISPYIRERARDKIILKDISPESSYEDGGVKIETRHNLHEDGVPTIGFKFSYKSKTIGYSGDCRFAMDDFNTHSKNFSNLQSALSSINWEQARIIAQLMHFNSESEARNTLRLTLKIRWGEKEELWLRPEEHIQDIVGFYNTASETTKTNIEATLAYIICSYKQKTPEWFSDCDMIIHEATNKDDPVHTNVAELEKLPEKIRQNMYLTHLPEGFREEYKGNIPILKEGMRYRI